ncbi:hypothetical protein [Desulfogranum japonicum]|uniref:hypothetical protein n=1 Tax=Desulfogranum japonicum TaxID=231447 RepID=UPI00041C4F33|nr:hypothetical protein [Desulfogranum japonicum]
MKLHEIVIQIRPRTPYQAMDLGVLMAKRWFLQLVGLWLAAALPLLILSFILGWLLPGKILTNAFVCFWILHPISEPVMISWIGPALFGTPPSFFTTLKRWRQGVSILQIAAILFGRFNPMRSFNYAVLQLEQLRGKPRKQRLQQLCQNQDGSLVLTLCCFALELLIACSLFILGVTLIPEEIRWFTTGEAAYVLVSWFLVVLFVVATLLVAPFYVCMGFMLYISRRVELEAWDIEIGFKALNDRLHKEAV